jgi:hypothetical protein
MLNITNYIASGIIEMYVLGICGEDEKAALIEYATQYAEIAEAIMNVEKNLEKIALTKSIPAPPALKQKILAGIFLPGSYNIGDM